ncbi:MAG TPA: hypothetical protein VFQ54_13105, partial [Thermomicrobiales bacterium]|nr:hypothetical protein [Thermomicrobiales bacterium]
MIARIPPPWRIPLAVLAAILVVVIAIGVVLAVAAPTKDEPTPTADGSPPASPTDTSLTPTEKPAGSPSPEVSPTPVPGSLDAMLQMTPDRLSDGSLPLPFVASYADISGWMAQNGIAVPTSLSDPNVGAFERELSALSLPTSLATRGMEPIWEETYGFNLAQVHQIMMSGQAPDSIFIMTGDFDATALRNAWAASGYQAVKVEGTTIWTLWPADSIDLSAPASRPALGSLNNIVLLPDGTLIAAAKISQLQSVLKVRNGDASPLSSNGDVKRMIASQPDINAMISAVIEKGDLLATLPPPNSVAGATPDDTETDQTVPASSPQAVEDAIAAMPEVKLTLIGLRRTAMSRGGAGTPGAVSAVPGTPATDVTTPVASTGDQADFVMILVFANDDDARVASGIVSDRLATGRSTVTNQRFRERIANPQLTVTDPDSDAHLVVLHAHLTAG